MRRPFFTSAALRFASACLALGLSGCSDDPPAKTKADVAASETTDDAHLADVVDAGLTLPSGKHVGADLNSFLPAAGGDGAFVRLWADTDTFTGSAAQARKGDWVIGNKDFKIAIQGPDRHIGVCPWGGNAIDGTRLRADGTWSSDEMGEQCLLFNLGRTLKAEHFEVLADGKDGKPAILAVTGEDTVLDFINLPSLLGGFLGIDSELPMDPDGDLPVTITRYFIVGAGAASMTVVTAFRNDSDKQLIIGSGELIDSGGEVEFFNPASKAKGFGSGGGFSAQALDYIAFRGVSGSHAFAPPLLNGKPGASYLAVGGAAGILLGTSNLLPLLLGGKAAFEKSKAAIRIDAAKIVTHHHIVTVGDGGIDSLSAPIWQARGAKLRTIKGTAAGVLGKPIAGARISALISGSAHTQAITGADGSFSIALPEGGKWSLLGWHAGHGVSDEVPVTDSAAKLTFSRSGTLLVKVVGTGDKPRPAKVTIYCDKKCPVVPSTVKDSGLQNPGGGALVARFVPMSGELAIPVPVGQYKVVVTGGPTASIWPEDVALSGGALAVVSDGKITTIDAVVRDAVDTSGWLSADFHVHSVNSPDAPVENRRRVLSFLAEGVDVLVPTDHDYITDMTPHIAAEKASSRLATLSGVELTTFDYGHFNAFPLKHDPKDLNGASLDWAGGDGPGLDPPEIQKALSKMGSHGPAVVQINHPQNYMATIQVDILGGISLAPRGPYRVKPKATDPKTGDTGMFTDDFTAMEIMTGHRGGGFGGGDSFAQNLNWWFTMLSRGVHWTGTATSDTHRSLSSQAGGARSYVFVGAGKDTVATLDIKQFAERVNAGQVVGSDGPFARMWAVSGGNKAAIGETLAVGSGHSVTVTIDVQGPVWMDLSRVELYLTPTETFAPAASPMVDMPKPHAVFTWKKGANKPVPGKDPKTQRWQMQATFELNDVTKDGYVVAIVHGDKAMPKALFAGREVKPLSFTNPIYLDADGGGYNKPPLTKKTQEAPRPPPPPRAKRPPSYDQLMKVLQAIECH